MLQISKNFHIVNDNMCCPCCNAIIYRDEFIAKVQTLRDRMAIPFYLSKKGGGFYRCPSYNESIGGVKDSQHLLGNAMDILSLGWNGAVKWKFIKEATELGLSIGIYDNPSFFHVDDRDGKPVAW